MLKELTKSEWLNILQLPESRIPAVLVVRGTRNLRAKYQAMLPHFANVLEVGTPNGIIEDVLIGDVAGCPVGFACVYGGSMASEIVHIFGMLGTRAVIQIGNCGALADDVGAGDLFIAERAYCGEGAARYYKPDCEWVTASTDLLESQTLTAMPSTAYRTGAIYTTAALFAEGMEDVDRWFSAGFAAVDMETAATYAVAEHFGMDRLSILYAFDNPRRREHLLQSDAEKDVRRASGNERMIELALDLALEICGQTSALSAILLRDVAEGDLPIFYEQQRDADATQMAALPARHRDAFMAHWTKILGDENVNVKTILLGGQVAGNIVSWDRDRKRLVGYWIGRNYWGKGVATRALTEFLGVVKARPLYAYVAKNNSASVRVLEKCGFRLCSEETEALEAPGDGVEEFVMKLAATMHHNSA